MTRRFAFLLSVLLPGWLSAAEPAPPPAIATIQQLNEAFAAGSLTSEALVRELSARIDAYDKAGPRLNALLARNVGAIEAARELDRERRLRGPRTPLHGIPVILKDNIDTADLPTTGGSVLLEGSIPPDDAFIVKRLRAAGAILLAKANMSEFALGEAFSSLGGQMRNPHDLARTPAGSSGGTAIAIAAAYAPLGFGTDTGGSIRAPAFANGIVGLKPTYGLISRDGIMPLALSLDTVGPMARSVADIALVLGLLTGIDAADPATRQSAGRFSTDYMKSLDAGALQGARIGIVRNFMGYDRATDWIVEAALAVMRDRGATVMDVNFPEWLLDDASRFYSVVVDAEFDAQIPAYLRTLAPSYPRTLEQLLTRAEAFRSPRADGASPNPARWSAMKWKERIDLTDYRYRSVREHGLALMTAMLEGAFDADRLDAVVYPTWERPAGLIDGSDARAGRPFVECLPNLAGLPELSVPAGSTGNGLPVGLSLMGRRFGEARLLALGYSFERAVRTVRFPVNTPAELH